MENRTKYSAGPETSVLLPVRDAGAFLAPAVESVLAQSYRDFELLLIDDHSRDGAIAALPHGDQRLRVLSSEGHGVSAAFGTGLRAARGRFVARMDADDLCAPRRLEQQLAHLKEHPHLGLVGAQVQIFAADRVGGGNLRYQEWLNSLCTPERIAAQIFVECPIPNPSAMFRREVLERLGGYRETDWPEDYDLFLRADRKGIRMGKPLGILLHWREHERRATHKNPRYSLANFQRAKVHHFVRGRLSGRELILMGAGPTGAALCDLLLAEGVSVLGFLELHPRRIGGLKRGLPVWSYGRLLEDDLPLLLGSVGSPGGRAELGELLGQHAKLEGQDYLFMA